MTTNFGIDLISGRSETKFIIFNHLVCQNGQISPGDTRLRCYACSTVNGSDIVAGAGVDPGVFLSTIALGSLPITHRCADPFDPNDSIRAGVAYTVCEDGLCVKINYTDKWTRTDSAQQQCYSCTTPEAESTLRGVRDKDWQRWLNSVRTVPRSPTCADPFDSKAALKSGAVLEECERGVCMKMWFRERAGRVQIWRTCIPRAKGVVRTDCTKITSSEGDMEVCTCDGNACNAARTQSTASLWITYAIGLLFASLLHWLFNVSHDQLR